jgi:hypothetical protein
MKKLSYDPKQVMLNLSQAIEIQGVEDPEKGLVRLRYATEKKIVNTGFRFEEDKYIHSTLVDKIDTEHLADYTLEASRNSTRGLTIVTKPNGYIGVEGSGVYPQTKTEMEASILDTLSTASNYIDNIHPKILKRLRSRK